MLNQRDRTIAGILALLCVTGPFLSCYLVNGLWAGFGETRIAWWGMHGLVLSPTLNLMAASALLSQQVREILLDLLLFAAAGVTIAAYGLDFWFTAALGI